MSAESVNLSTQCHAKWLLPIVTALAVSGCADTGPATQTGPRLVDVSEAIRQCGHNQRRMQLANAKMPVSGQGSYTNLQDSDGKRQTEMSDPSGKLHSSFRCVP